MTLNFFKNLQALSQVVVVNREKLVVEQRNQVALLTFQFLSNGVGTDWDLIDEGADAFHLFVDRLKRVNDVIEFLVAVWADVPDSQVQFFLNHLQIFKASCNRSPLVQKNVDDLWDWIKIRNVLVEVWIVFFTGDHARKSLQDDSL